MSKIEDESAITRLLYRYAQAWDNDVDLCDELFTDDASIDFPTRDADGQVRNDVRQVYGPIEMKARIAALQDRGAVCQHLVSNAIIDVSGDTASGQSEIRAFAVFRMLQSGNLEITDRIAHFEDDFRRTADGWRISRRKCNVRWVEARIAYSSKSVGITEAMPGSEGTGEIDGNLKVNRRDLA